MEGAAVLPAVTPAGADSVSPEACGAPCALPGPEQGRGCPACLRYSGHCLHTMYGWLQAKHTQTQNMEERRGW